MGVLFGTDGVRGAANIELTPLMAFNLGRAGAYILTKENKHAPSIIIGKDTRISGDMLEAALTAGMCSVGANVISAGVIPTPAIAYLVRKYGLDAGVVISASHNPYPDNGIKFFNGEGYKLKDELENEIEDIILNGGLDNLPAVSGAAIGRRTVAKNALEDYTAFLEETLDGLKFDGINIAVDCANGATYKAAPTLLHKLGASVSALAVGPDGTNINDNCGSTHMEALTAHVKAGKFDIGIAFDGDGDRCLAIDEQGNMIDGDQIMSICGNYLKDNGLLAKNCIVATVMSNLGFMLMGEEYGINIEKTAVGDRYVLEKMLECGYVLGGEQSGHVIFLNRNTTGDGLLTAITLVSIMKRTGKKLSELNCYMEKLPQVLINAKVPNDKKEDYLTNEAIQAEINRITEKFEGKGRVLIRPSGTEPLVRVMIEGKDIDEITNEALALAKMLEDTV